MRKDNQKSIRVYSGTRLDNYQTCSRIINGNCFFDKRREPKHSHERFYFDESFNTAAIFAYGSLDAGKLFSVSKTWEIKPETDWHKLISIPLININLEDYFEEVDPAFLLQK